VFISCKRGEDGKNVTASACGEKGKKVLSKKKNKKTKKKKTGIIKISWTQLRRGGSWLDSLISTKGACWGG